MCREQEELLGLPFGDESGQGFKNGMQGARASTDVSPWGQRQRREQAGKLCPDLERASGDRPLDLWHFLLSEGLLRS